MAPRMKSFVGGMVVGAGLFYTLTPRRRSPAPVRYGSRAGDIAGLEAASLSSPGGRFTSSLGSGRDRRRVVDIQKTLHIDAPVDRVYAFWSNYENFPLFMSNVRSVQDLGSGRSRWSVRGPGGIPVVWNAVVTQQVPNQVIAWRSEPGAMLENAGVVRFHPEGATTRIDLRFCYRPLAGLAGDDPRAKVNEDLGRLKTLLESTVRSDTHGQEPWT